MTPGKSAPVPVEVQVSPRVRRARAEGRADEVPEDVVDVRGTRREEELDQLDPAREDEGREEDVDVDARGGAPRRVEVLEGEEAEGEEEEEVPRCLLYTSPSPRD